MGLTDKIIAILDEFSASDIHIRTGKKLALRVHGNISQVGEVLTEEEVNEFVQASLSEKQRKELESQRDVDLAMNIGKTRFRLNVFFNLATLSISLRKIEDSIIDMEMLGLPWAVTDMLEKENGLILVTGATGSGKSTSLSAMIDYLNAHRSGHILTIEDPIETIHTDKKCIVSQREIGRDAQSFKTALRAALREDPDVILIGEMRDQETIELALTAAETGHLVFGTLHTSTAVDAVNRIVDAVPEGKQSQVRGQIAQSLLMVLSQRLFRRADGTGRVAAYELMVCTSAIRNLIRENKAHQMISVMQTGGSSGMVLLDDSISQLKQMGTID